MSDSVVRTFLELWNPVVFREWAELVEFWRLLSCQAVFLWLGISSVWSTRPYFAGRGRLSSTFWGAQEKICFPTTFPGLSYAIPCPFQVPSMPLVGAYAKLGLAHSSCEFVSDGARAADMFQLWPGFLDVTFLKRAFRGVSFARWES